MSPRAASDSAPPRSNRRVVRASPTPAKAYAPPVVRRPALRERIERQKDRMRALWERLRGPLALGLRVVSAVAVAACAVATFRLVERWARTSPQFALRELTLEGEERLAEDELFETAGIALGDNVFARSPEEIRAALAAHPWVAEAHVERRLPGTLSIRITERRAVAVLVLESPYLVADEGTLIERAEPGEAANLPLIVGVDPDLFVADQAFRTRVLLDAVALLSEYEASGLAAREPVSEVRVEREGELTLFVGDDAMEVRLGAGPFRRKLERLTTVLAELSERDARAAYVLLDNERSPGRVTVRLR